MTHARALIVASLAGLTLATSGCAVWRGQSSVATYANDKAIATAVKTRFIEDKTVDAIAISVDTLHGTVALSGFAKSNAERAQAEHLARNTKGVREVRNYVVVRAAR